MLTGFLMRNEEAESVVCPFVALWSSFFFLYFLHSAIVVQQLIFHIF